MRMAVWALFLLPWLQGPKEPVASPHHRGPGNLEGWTLKWTVPEVDEGPLPRTLVIARSGKVLRKIEGDGFVWAWMFQNRGTQVAIETGPMHFSLACRLYDVASGRELADFDCFHDPTPATAPPWVKRLKDSGQAFED